MQTNISPLVIQDFPQPKDCSYPSATGSCLLPFKCRLPHFCSVGTGKVVSIPAAILGITGSSSSLQNTNHMFESPGMNMVPGWMFNNQAIISVGCYHHLKVHFEKSSHCSVLLKVCVLHASYKRRFPGLEYHVGELCPFWFWLCTGSGWEFRISSFWPWSIVLIPP